MKINPILAFLIILCFISKSVYGQGYFNRIIPFEFGNENPNVTELTQIENKFYILAIYFTNDNEEDLSTLIEIEGTTYNYHHYENFVFSFEGTSTIDDSIYLFAKDRSQAKGLKLAKLNSEFGFEWKMDIETLGDYNFSD